MKPRRRYRKLMEEIRQAHLEFKQVWESVRADELAKQGVKIGKGRRPNEGWRNVWDANRVAYRAAQSKADRRDELLILLFDELPFEEFMRGESAAIDAILDFLEIDVMAFRCGYAKEDCLRVLKRFDLTPQQVERLKRLTLAMCQFRGQRRELADLTRLMIPLADQNFLRDLEDLSLNVDDLHNKRKVERVLKVILHNRPDLK